MQLLTTPPTMTASVFDTVSAYFSGSFGTLAIFVIGIIAFFWVVDMIISKFSMALEKRRAGLDFSGSGDREIDEALEFHRRYKATMAGSDKISTRD